MSLYPSLEDMKVDQLARAQNSAPVHHHPAVAGGYAPAPHPTSAPAPHPTSAPSPQAGYTSLYPSLGDYMGLALTPDVVEANMPGYTMIPYPQQQNAVAVQGPKYIAPVTGENNLGVMRAEVKQGIREVVLCKNSAGIVGIRLRHISQGIFVSLVAKDTPAALGGLRFGDQVLQINGKNMAGCNMNDAMDMLRRAKADRITMAVRDRPFERTITMQKDSGGHVGFVYKNGKITKLVKDSSAARNGLLTDHNMVEVNGQNVVSMKDDNVERLLTGSGTTITITVMPTFVFEHMVKCMSTGLMKGSMDHSVPDI